MVLAVDVTTFKVGSDTPTPTTYEEGVELWLQLPDDDQSACEEGRASVYLVASEGLTLVDHRCETDDSGKTWTVSVLHHFSTYTLVIEPAPAPQAATPTPGSSQRLAHRAAAPEARAHAGGGGRARRGSPP